MTNFVKHVFFAKFGKVAKVGESDPLTRDPLSSDPLREGKGREGRKGTIIRKYYGYDKTSDML